MTASAAKHPLSPHRYLDIADQLQQAIRAGHYPVDSYLPTEKNLCQQFNSSRHTVRAALQELQKRGFISRRQGSGSKVIAREGSFKYNLPVDSIEDLLEYGKNTYFKILSSKKVTADLAQSELLECSPGTECTVLHGLRYESREAPPLCTSDVYRLTIHRPHNPEYDNPDNAIFALVNELTLEQIGEVNQQIAAVALSAKQAEELDASAGSPALQITRRYISVEGELLIVATSTYPSNCFTYTSNFVRTAVDI